jgi:hypothetical protein
MSKKMFLFYLLLMSITSVFNPIFVSGMEQEQKRVVVFSLEELKKICNKKDVTFLDIRLGSSQIGENQKFVTFIESFNQFSNLINLKLNLGFNQIKISQAEELGICLGNLENLNTLRLDLMLNQIKDEGVEGLGESFNQLSSSLVSLYLDLKCNEITTNGAEELVVSLGKLKNLTSLDLNLRHNYQIKDEGVKKFLTNLGILLPNLVSLALKLDSSDKIVQHIENLLFLVKNKYIKKNQIYVLEEILCLPLGTGIQDINADYYI